MGYNQVFECVGQSIEMKKKDGDRLIKNQSNRWARSKVKLDDFPHGVVRRNHRIIVCSLYHIKQKLNVEIIIISHSIY